METIMGTSCAVPADDAEDDIRSKRFIMWLMLFLSTFVALVCWLFVDGYLQLGHRWLLGYAMGLGFLSIAMLILAATLAITIEIRKAVRSRGR